jgi:hypothetical protein
MPARTATRVYEASPIRRSRSTKGEVEARREALLAIIDDGKPMTVRQVFYQATVRGIVEKEETGYKKVQVDLTKMRRDGSLPYDWLADNTRWQRKPDTFDSVEDAIKETARFYRKSLWRDADAYVEVWLEKDALSGVIYPITSMYDVPLMVARAMPRSRSCLAPPSTSTNLLCRPTSITLATSIPPVSTLVRRSRKPFASLRPTPRLTSSVLPSRGLRFACGICRRDPPRSPTAGQKASARSASSLTPSNPTRCGTSYRTQSSGTFRQNSLKC